MSDEVERYTYEQLDLFESDTSRSLLDKLIADSKLYRTSKDYKDLLNFVVRLRGFAPFNAMLLQIQKPGLSYAASARDWSERFRRRPKEGARPLIILWPFGPVALVYDVLDTEGDPLPEDVWAFVAKGTFARERLQEFERRLGRSKTDVAWIDEGDNHAGEIRLVNRADDGDKDNHYKIEINRNHPPEVQFSTLAHELGHLFLGHIGPDAKLRIPQRRALEHSTREIEAESVAYIVCYRNGVTPKSQRYLSQFLRSDMSIEDIDIYQVMRAAGQVEALLGLSVSPRFDKAGRASIRRT